MTAKGLFEPITIGDVEIDNRIAMAPMNVVTSTQDGYVTPQDIAHLARRAKGGFGLVITGAIICSRLAAPFVFHRNMYLYDESFIPGLGNMVDTVHHFGAKIFAQLSVGFGRQGHALDGTTPYAPSAIPMSITPDNLPKGFREAMMANPYTLPISYNEIIPREMTIEEIKSEQKEYALACQRAVVCGFDGIEIHAPHGYLEHEFLSPRTNRRTDLYGGSLQNRMRFVLELMLRALDATKGAVPIGIRLSADEHMPEGIGIDEMIEVHKTLQDWGLNYLHLSDGSYEALKYFFPDSIEHVRDHLLVEAKKIKKSLKIPLMTPGVNDAAIAEKAIKEGATDMISLGRQSLADPDWPQKVKDGKQSSIKVCKRDCMCVIRPHVGLYPRCTVNPEVGFEQYDPDLLVTKRTGAILPKRMHKLPAPQPH